MKKLFLVSALLLILIPVKSFSQEFDDIKGTWVVDLKPSPDSEPYLKEFVVGDITGKTFIGTFYDTEFKEGKLNNNWEVIYFAFSTSDYSIDYFHSGYFKDGVVYGISYAPGRDLLIPWTGKKKE